MTVTWLELLHELCRQAGYALLLTAEHAEQSAHLPFAQSRVAATTLKNLDVWQPSAATLPRRRRRLIEGELIVRCDLAAVDGDLQAAAELLVGFLHRVREQAA